MVWLCYHETYKNPYNVIDHAGYISSLIVKADLALWLMSSEEEEKETNYTAAMSQIKEEVIIGQNLIFLIFT